MAIVGRQVMELREMGGDFTKGSREDCSHWGVHARASSLCSLQQIVVMKELLSVAVSLVP